MRASSASDRAPIFSMTRARWTLMVFSTVPRSPAICLFNFPATTMFEHLSLARCERREPFADDRHVPLRKTGNAVRLDRLSDGPEQIPSSLTGLERKFSAPARIARTLVGMSA